LVAPLLRVGADETQPAQAQLAQAQPAERGPVSGARTVESTVARPAIERAIHYLTDQTAQWAAETTCYACHHHGDGARALMMALERGWPVPPQALLASRPWLSAPRRWDEEGRQGEFFDPTLSAIQFGSAMLVARQVYAGDWDAAIQAAAAQAAQRQQADGSWQIDAPGTLGSPITYGPFLATARGRELMIAAGSRYDAQRQRAERWLARQVPRSVMDAAVLLMIEQRGFLDRETEQLETCLALINRGQQASGGWGPYVVAQPEAFDTALVLLGLERLRTANRDAEEPQRVEGASALSRPALPDSIAKSIATGRRYLVATQREDGSWPPTTRPAGALSHAQRVSTTAWALLSLLDTEPAHGNQSITYP
jgi:hypothetical protein